MARTALETDLTRCRTHPVSAPPSGWIRAIRDALGMSASEMAHRMGVTKARIAQIERGERDRSLTLDSLDRAAAALGCRVEFVLVPHQPLEDMVLDQARTKAAAQISAVDHSMALENQLPDQGSNLTRINEAARRLIDKRGLWS